jgi:protein O-mannosyl-transferase
MSRQRKTSREPDEPKTARTHPSMRWQLAIVAAGLVLATIAAYWTIHKAQFIAFDDPLYITDNYHVQSGLSWAGVKWALTTFHAGNWHPLTWLSHMLDTTLFGHGAACPHLVNLTLHISNTLLLLAFFLYATGRLWPAALAAALFALHPLHVESVAWAAERKDVLSTLFWMLTMLAWAWYARRPAAGRYLLALAMMALGLMAKPMLVTMPIVLLLLDYWPLGRAKEVRLSRLVLEKVPFACLSLAMAVATVLAQDRSIIGMTRMSTAPILANAVVSYGRYMLAMVWPANLCVYYPHPHRVLAASTAIVGVILLAVTVIAWRERKKYPYVLAGWLWYIITLIPVIGIVQVGDQSHADRYTYIPLTGLFVIVAWGCGDVIRRWPGARAAIVVVAGAVLLTLAAVTHDAALYWKDSLTLLTRANEISPNNGKLESLLGTELAERGHLEDGMALLRKAIETEGHDGSAYNALGSVYLLKGDPVTAKWYFLEAAKHDWTNVKAEYCLGMISLSGRSFGEALEHLRRAVQLNPLGADTHSLLAIALSETGNMAEATAECNEALRLDPEAGMAHYARGYILARAGDFAGAAAAYEKSIAKVPTSMAYSGLGDAQFRMGQFEAAAGSYKNMTELAPKQADGYYNLGLALEKLGRTAEAAQAIGKSLNLSPNDVDAQAMYKRLGGQ